MSYLLELNSMWRDRRRFISEGDMETLLCRDASDRNGGGGDGYIASYAAKYATALGDVNGEWVRWPVTRKILAKMVYARLYRQLRGIFDQRR